MSTNAKVPAAGVRIDGPEGVIRIAVPANAEAAKVNARRRAIQAYGPGGFAAIGRVPSPRTAKVNGQAVLLFDFTPVTTVAPAKGSDAPSKRRAAKASPEVSGVSVAALVKAGLPKAAAEAVVASLSPAADAPKAERTQGRWSGVACRTCRDFGQVKRTPNAKGRVTYRTVDGAAESIVDGRSVACPDHTQGSSAEAKATRKALKAAIASYRAKKAAAEAATA